MPRDDDTAAEEMRRARKNGAALEPMHLINPADWESVPVPPRVWIVKDWLPVGHVTADYGDGGTGKTLLAQQLQTSCSTGFAWCGLYAERCRSLGLYCEDSEAELHRRQADICRAFGLLLRECGDMRLISGLGADNTLATFTSDGKMQETPRFATLEQDAKDFAARLVILDTAADLFAGNENDRNQVRRFIGLLSRLAQAIDGAVLLNAHPSRNGLSTGNLDGGSTAWSNSVRSRWSLARPKSENDDEPHPDTNQRILERRKSNYASIGDAISLRWVNGVLVPATAEGNVAGGVQRAVVEAVFLELLDRCETAGLRVTALKNAGNWAPRVFAQRPDAQGYSVKDFERAMAALFASRQIGMQTYGRAGDARQQIVRAIPPGGAV